MQLDCADECVAESSSSDLTFASKSALTSCCTGTRYNRFSLPPVFLPPALQGRRTTSLKLQGKTCCLSCPAATLACSPAAATFLQTFFTGQHLTTNHLHQPLCPRRIVLTVSPASATLISRTAWPRLFCTPNRSEQQLIRWNSRTAVSLTPQVQIVTCTSWPQLLPMPHLTGQVGVLQPVLQSCRMKGLKPV